MGHKIIVSNFVIINSIMVLNIKASNNKEMLSFHISLAQNVFWGHLHMNTRQDTDLICSFCSDSVWLPRVCDIGKLIWHYVKCSELCNEQVTSDTVDGHTVDTLIKICLQDPTSLHSGLLEEILAFKSIISSCLRSHTGHTGHWWPHWPWSVPTQSVKNIMYTWKIIWI